MDRDKDRDISEKIALGMPGAPPSNESMFDQRLFNTSQVSPLIIRDCFNLSLSLSQGLDSGLGLLDDVYNVYDKPWRAGGGAAQTIYKPSKVADKDIYGDDVEKLIKTSR